MNKILAKDIQDFVQSFTLSQPLNNTHFLVTGATGLIGSILVRCLLALDLKIKITIPVRCKEKAMRIYGEDMKQLNIVECDLIEWIRAFQMQVDYIVHCASPTNGKYMTANPVDTYELAIESTQALLRYAVEKRIKSMVYVSSLEYYGQILNCEEKIYEDVQGYINATSPRSSYPMGKRAAEYLCYAYAAEYNVPVKIARLTQTFGAGISEEDNRVFAQFAKSVINNMDIVLHTAGESAKPYCYTTDCISAILTILVNGIDGEAYNVANENTYISVRDMAEFLKSRFNPTINVIVEQHPEMGYAPVTKLDLSVEKLVNIGWRPKYGLEEMFERLIESMK